MSQHTIPSRRPWYQFSLRTLFVVVALVSIPLAWVGYSLNWIRQRRELVREGWVIEMPYPVFNGERPDAPCGLWIFGEKGRGCLICQPGDKELVKRLFTEAVLWEDWERDHPIN